MTWLKFELQDRKAMHQCTIKIDISLSVGIICLIISCYADANGLARQQKEGN